MIYIYKGGDEYDGLGHFKTDTKGRRKKLEDEQRSSWDRRALRDPQPGTSDRE